MGKKRVESHIKGEQGVKLLKECFPKEWVAREYTLDYGIDMSVELFDDYVKGGATKGEHIFFQVKTTESLMYDDYVFRQSGIHNKKMEVVKFVIDTDLLSTVERMSPAVPVILAVIELKTKNIYFLCLNDYIDKVLFLNDPEWLKKKTKTLYIPVKNKLNSTFGINVIEWYAKRPKLYALINKINCQVKSLQYCDHQELNERIIRYIEDLYRLDVWDNTECFGYMDTIKPKLDYFMKHGITKDAKRIIEELVESGKNIDEPIYESSHCVGLVSLRETHEVWGIHELWNELAMLGELLETLAREAYLPTELNQIFS